MFFEDAFTVVDECFFRVTLERCGVFIIRVRLRSYTFYRRYFRGESFEESYREAIVTRMLHFKPLVKEERRQKQLVLLHREAYGAFQVERNKRSRVGTWSGRVDGASSGPIEENWADDLGDDDNARRFSKKKKIKVEEEDEDDEEERHLDIFWSIRPKYGSVNNGPTNLKIGM